MSRFFLLTGAILGFLSVAIGAFGAHALKPLLSEYGLSIFNTASQYHMLHSAVLLVIALLLKNYPLSKLLTYSGYSIIFGIVVFSGSLYALAITGISILGAITPIGGLGFLIGWATLVIFAAYSKPIH